MSSVTSVSKQQLFSLTPEELTCFGWGPEEGLQSESLVFAIRSPMGFRSIPTRQLLSTGQVIYGSVETLEAPCAYYLEDWDAQFDLDEEALHGTLM